MSKRDVVEAVKKELGLKSMKAASECFDKVCSALSKLLVDGSEVELTGIGQFKHSVKGEHTARNPMTGAQITVPEKRAVKFKVSSKLKKSLNTEKSHEEKTE